MICLTLLDYLSVGIGEDIAAVFGTNDVAGFRGCEGEVLRGVVVKGSCWSVHLDSNKLYLIKINDGRVEAKVSGVHEPALNPEIKAKRIKSHLIFFSKAVRYAYSLII